MTIKEYILKKHDYCNFYSFPWQKLNILKSIKNHIFMIDSDLDPILNFNLSTSDRLLKIFIDKFSEKFNRKQSATFIKKNEDNFNTKNTLTIERFKPTLAQNLMIIMKNLQKFEPELNKKLDS